MTCNNNFINQIRNFSGFSASVLLFISIFTPLYVTPLNDTVTLFQHGKYQSVVMLIAISVVILFGFMRKWFFCWFPCFIYLVSFYSFIHSQHEKLNSATMGIAFIKNAVMENVKIQWPGWAMIIIGVLLLMTSALPEKTINVFLDNFCKQKQL